MSDDIRPGDVVVCVDDSPYRSSGPMRGRPWPMARGSLWRVAWAGVALRGPSAGDPIIRLFNEPELPPGKRGWGVERFRKLDAAEDCFTNAMRELRPLETQPAEHERARAQLISTQANLERVESLIRAAVERNRS